MTLFRNKISSAVLFVTLVYFFTKPNVSFAQSGLEQVGRLPISVYPSEEYGGNPGVWTAIESDEGLMYFGTSEGIHEYDGVSWRSIFGRDKSIVIRTLAKNTQGRIFYAGGSVFGYLTINEKGETEAKSLMHLIPEEFGQGHDFFTIQFLDNFLFLQSREHLIRLELGEDFSLRSLKTWTAEATFTYTFLIDGKILIHQYERGLYQLYGDDLKLIPGTEVLGNDRFRIMIPYPSADKQTYLLGGFTTGFFLFDGTSLSKFQTEVDQMIQKGTGSLYNAIPFEGNYIFSFNGNGIVTMNPQGKILRKISSDQGLPSDVVRGIYLDQSKGLWAMTEDGIARITINSPILTFGKEQGISSAVLSIQKKGEDFFLGTSVGLLKFEKENRRFQQVLQGINTQIFDLLVDGDNLLLPSISLQVYKDEKLITLEGPEDGSRPISLKIPTNNRNVLISGTTTGLLLYKRGLSKEFPWEFSRKIPNIGGIGTLVFEGKDGTLFFGGPGFLYASTQDTKDLETSGAEEFKPKVFQTGPSDFYSFIDQEFYWLGSEGIKKYSEQAGQFIPTDEFQAFEKDLYDLGQTQSGQVWFESLSGKKHLLKRDETGKFVIDNTSSSLTPHVSEVSFLDENGIEWFGSPKGLIRYDPSREIHKENKFFTLIRRIETKTDTIPLPFYGRRKDLAPVERKENSFRFEFAAPYFEDEKKTKYQTYLEGFDPDWVDWNDNRFKEYTNLSPGTYTFHVRAMSLTGRISEEAVYSFVVLAPWYATWWAYIAYALLIGAAITGIVKWRSKTLKAENRRLEDRVKERTLALEKSLSELQSTQAQLIQSEKMASLGELTAGIAHEIQNPLNFVNNFSELTVELIDEMKEEIEKGDFEEVQAIAADLKENLTKIHHHGKRAGSIVRGMLAHSRKSSSEKEETDLNALADECLRLSFHGLRAKDKTFQAEFKLEQDPSLPKIQVVSQDIGRVLINLINNAFYAVSEKAQKGIPEYRPIVEVSTNMKGSQVEISVIDNGLGIPKSIQDKIFQPFFTTKPTGSGTGLGLSLSYDIVKAHGGELTVESTEGKGTAFRILLPI